MLNFKSLKNEEIDNIQRNDFLHIFIQRDNNDQIDSYEHNQQHR